MGWEAPWHWVILAVIVIALFGYKKMPDAARSLGRSLRIFKTEIKGMSDDDKAREQAQLAPATPISVPDAVVPQAAPVAQPSPVAQPAPVAQAAPVAPAAVPVAPVSTPGAPPVSTPANGTRPYNEQ